MGDIRNYLAKQSRVATQSVERYTSEPVIGVNKNGLIEARPTARARYGSTSILALGYTDVIGCPTGEFSIRSNRAYR